MARGETDDTQDFNAATAARETAPTPVTPTTTGPAQLRSAAPRKPGLGDTQQTPTQATELSFDDDDDDDWIRTGVGAGRATPAADGPDDPNGGVAGHRRGPGLWTPLIAFVVLLVAAAVVGRFVVPATVPAPGAAPPAASRAPTPTVDESTTGAAPSTGPAIAPPPARPADALAAWAGQVHTAVGIPEVAAQAYGYAQLSVQGQTPGCHLTWTTLAGIGSVESDHGQAGGAVLASTGRSTPPILGPALDGRNGRALVADTDAGAFDGDTTFDHAMGPLGILPSVWRTYAIDADADGILDPYDIDDAALAMGRLLCSGNDDLSQRAGWLKAVARQHAGTAYAQSVFNAADSYGQRTRDIG